MQPSQLARETFRPSPLGAGAGLAGAVVVSGAAPAVSVPGAGSPVSAGGGSAGPGLLTELGDSVDGLFLGRFAHDPDALLAVLDEAAALAESSR